MADDPRPWLDDILDGITWIERMTAGKTFTDFRTDRPLRDAVERNLERISEASRHLPDSIKDAHPQMPWRQIAQIGNILRHAYRRVDPVLIWEIVELDLPALRSVVDEAQQQLAKDHGA
jgi:uncharacterized protein with HEPN domain